MNSQQQELLNTVMVMFREIHEGLVHDHELADLSDSMTKRNHLLLKLFDQASDQDKYEFFQVLDVYRKKEQVIIEEYRVRQEAIQKKIAGIKKVKKYLE